mmetsp:Transcript_56514/g.112360  ORF Transcript_56514/g.112360 Transcript_56514/m.112360 type:complete len:105 (-) Transcript_56514:131-445(-)
MLTSESLGLSSSIFVIVLVTEFAKGIGKTRKYTKRQALKSISINANITRPSMQRQRQLQRHLARGSSCWASTRCVPIGELLLLLEARRGGQLSVQGCEREPSCI